MVCLMKNVKIRVTLRDRVRKNCIESDAEGKKVRAMPKVKLKAE